MKYATIYAVNKNNYLHLRGLKSGGGSNNTSYQPIEFNEFGGLDTYKPGRWGESRTIDELSRTMQIQILDRRVTDFNSIDTNQDIGLINDDLSGLNELPDNIRDKIVFIRSNNDIDLTLTQGTLPKNLKHLELGWRFSNGAKPLEPNVLPPSLKYLELGWAFKNGDKPLTPNVLPRNLTHLILGADFNNGGQYITRDVLSPNLTHLEFGFNFTNDHKPITRDDLPTTITHLVLGFNFNNGGEYLIKDILPPNLKYLAISYKFNKGGLPPTPDYLPLIFVVKSQWL